MSCINGHVVVAFKLRKLGCLLVQKRFGLSGQQMKYTTTCRDFKAEILSYVLDFVNMSLFSW
jgi:hypothetical protein